MLGLKEVNLVTLRDLLQYIEMSMALATIATGILYQKALFVAFQLTQVSIAGRHAAMRADMVDKALLVARPDSIAQDDALLADSLAVFF